MGSLPVLAGSGELGVLELVVLEVLVGATPPFGVEVDSVLVVEVVGLGVVVGAGVVVVTVVVVAGVVVVVGGGVP